MEGYPKKSNPMLHSPYLFDQILSHSFDDVAHPIKDRFSIGMVILEILTRTTIVIPAICEELIENLLRDCLTYLNPATQQLIICLIFGRNQLDIQFYIDQFATGHYGVIQSDILRFEAAVKEDASLQEWNSKGTKLIVTQSERVYEKYRLLPEDVKLNIDQDMLETFRIN